MGNTKIVIGTDASPPSTEALRWAAKEARRWGVELEVVLAYHWHLPGVGLTASTDVIQAAVEEAAASTIDAAVAEARAAAPETRVHGRAVLGEPGPVLVKAGRDAAMVVVGSRGGGGFASLLAGSVSVQVATHAPCLVTVVRGRPDNDTGPVVVGVDGSPAADFATGVAFEQAVRRGSALRIVRAFGTPVSPWTLGVAPPRYDYDKVATDLNNQMLTHIAGWRNKYPDVPMQIIVERSSAGALLTAMSWRAQLVVVGTRGHGAPGGLLLGSVGLQLLHHAECPVLIARANATPATKQTPSALP